MKPPVKLALNPRSKRLTSRETLNATTPFLPRNGDPPHPSAARRQALVFKAEKESRLALQKRRQGRSGEGCAADTASDTQWSTRDPPFGL